jgi:hypothetical protein
MLADNDFVRTLAELDRLLNDPDVPMQPALIWRLVAEVAGRAWDGTQRTAMPFSTLKWHPTICVRPIGSDKSAFARPAARHVRLRPGPPG